MSRQQKAPADAWMHCGPFQLLLLGALAMKWCPRHPLLIRCCNSASFSARACQSCQASATHTSPPACLSAASMTADQPPPIQPDEYDIVVVGSGLQEVLIAW